MSSWPEMLTQADPGDHVVQLYGEDDQLLSRNVSRYLQEGLRRGDALVVIATPEHEAAIARILEAESGARAAEAGREGRLVFLDARTTLDRILVDGRLDPERFDAVVVPQLRLARARSRSGAVRAFGEMVSLLWCEGRQAEAAALEGRWNAVLATHACSLYCAYRIDLFREGIEHAALNAIVGSHTHLFAGPATMLSSKRSGM